MSDTFHEHLARQCAVGREKFGPGERSKGVREHILKEFVEIDNAETAGDRAREWVDVAILSLDGLLRATREFLREELAESVGIAYDDDGNVVGFNGEPTNDYVAAVTVEMIRQKQAKNELRDFGDWRGRSENEAIEHKRGTHD